MTPLASLSVLLFSGSALAAENSTYLSGLFQLLSNSGLSTLAGVALTINGTEGGAALLSELSENESLTIFAPTNLAFDRISGTISTSPDVLANVLSYHFVHGNFSVITQVYPNTTVGRTFLSNCSVVGLEGNKSQVLAWTRDRNSGNLTVLNQESTLAVSNSMDYENLHINVVDTVFSIPDSLEDVLKANNLTAMRTILDNERILYYNSTSGMVHNDSLIHILEGVNGFTLFAPTDNALSSIDLQMLGMSGNETSFQALLQNHMINGTTVYTPSLMVNNYTSSAGEQISGAFNGTGAFVISGTSGFSNATAKIVSPDVLVRNGVVHIIDSVLLDIGTNTDAASSAYVSATSVAQQSTTESGPVGSTPTGVAVLPTASTSSQGSVNAYASLLASLAIASMFASLSFVLL